MKEPEPGVSDVFRPSIFSPRLKFRYNLISKLILIFVPQKLIESEQILMYCSMENGDLTNIWLEVYGAMEGRMLLSGRWMELQWSGRRLTPLLQCSSAPVLHPRCCRSSAPSPLHASTLVLAMRVRIMRNHADIKRIHAYTLCQYYLELTLNFLEVQTNTLITFKIFQPWILKRGHNIGNLTFHSTQNVKL